MRRKLILVSLILLVITSRPGLCQADHGHSVNIIYSESLLSGELFDPASTPDISTFFNKEWLSGNIRLIDGRIILNKKIKYNGLLDELFWLEPVSNLTIKLDKESILQFHFLNLQGDTTIRFIKIKIKQDIFTDSIEIFSQEIKKGNLSLLISHHYYFAGREAVRMNKTLYLKEIYKEEPVYYLRFPDNRIVELKRFSRKNLFALIPDKKDLIRKYLKESISGKIRTDQEILDFVLFLSSFDY